MFYFCHIAYHLEIHLRIAVRVLCTRLPVSLVVHGDYIHGNVILLMWVQTRNLDTHGGEHPPDGKTK